MKIEEEQQQREEMERVRQELYLEEQEEANRQREIVRSFTLLSFLPQEKECVMLRFWIACMVWMLVWLCVWQTGDTHSFSFV